MDELLSAISDGEQCVSWEVFQAAMRDCEEGVITEEGAEGGTATGGGAVAELLTVQGECCSPKTQTVKLELENKELWKQFNKITNEMIVTKAGRRMFPLFQLSISGLSPSASYVVFLEFQITHNHRWRFLNGDWQAASASSTTIEPPEQRCVYVHPSSPQVGTQWMKEKLSFSKLKLSNKEDGKGKIKLYSLYRYQPCLHILQLTDRPKRGVKFTYPFTETQFVAVTAYQNDKITQMKIKHNPYAKAFQGPQDTAHFTRTSTDNSITTTPPHYHQPHLHTLTTPTQQATPTHNVLTHNWPQPYLYESYHTPYQQGHASYYTQQPLSASSTGATPLPMPTGQYAVPQRENTLPQQQTQVWYSQGDGGGAIQMLNSSQVPQLQYHSR